MIGQQTLMGLEMHTWLIKVDWVLFTARCAAWVALRIQNVLSMHDQLRYSLLTFVE